jgi:hypothetical protein
VKGTKTQTSKKKEENQRIQIQQVELEVYYRGNSGVPEERECTREKNDGVGMRREKIGIGRKKRKEGAE